MAVSKQDIQRLVRLQEQDRSLDGVQAAIDRVPADSQAVRNALEDEKRHAADLKTKSTRLQLTKKEKENDLSQKEEAVRKHSTDLNQVKTNEAYKALQSEIDKAKNDASELETAILMLMEELDQAARDEKAAAAAFKEAEVRSQARIQALEARQAELTAQRDAAKTQRDAGAAGLPSEVLKLYDQTRQRRQGVALAPVRGNMCGACRITILPQDLVEVTRGGSVVTCESCQRILYVPEAAEAASPSPQGS